MATDKADVGKTGDLFDTEEKQWLKVSLTNQIRSLERMMAKYPAGSGAHTAHGADVGKLRKMMEKVDTLK